MRDRCLQNSERTRNAHQSSERPFARQGYIRIDIGGIAVIGSPLSRNRLSIAGKTVGDPLLLTTCLANNSIEKNTACSRLIDRLNKMFNPPGLKEDCPHCKASKMEYYGSILGGFHYYYRCSNCRKYIEYRISSKKFLIMSSIIFVMMVFIIALPLFLLSISSLSAILFFFASLVLFSIFAFKYQRYFFEAIAIEDFQPNLWMIHALNKKIRLTTIAILIATLFVYVGIFVVNLIRQ